MKVDLNESKNGIGALTEHQRRNSQVSKVKNVVKLLKIFGIKESYAIGYRNYQGEEISYRDNRKYTLIMLLKMECYEFYLNVII